ncbi:threonine synthase [Pelotomaculum thermopropionicum SI]|uniref:Threonine synthase n=1 Tax=Pelotomaculum thermopropionicum (strain DSM 13744 / JCM 10971 / SI) TaxID=370438 RepID=A5CYT4_PELTS|nr:threonine synthase [Pelotomaculum thermopropionicum SI]
MLYESTRGRHGLVSPAEAIKLGISPDGGLFVPAGNVTVSGKQLEIMAGLSYREKAVLILKEFLSGFPEEEIKACVDLAYAPGKFDAPGIAPVCKLDASLYVLELWHGPTCAFKDMALQILPHLLTRAAAMTGEEQTIVILVATSGDTGKAALEGFKNVPGTKIIVFYPEQGVSEVQKLQMVTQEGENVAVVAVRGNFDDAQAGVKSIFGDREFNRELIKGGYRLSSANSINWGRLVPQIVYYFSAYLDLMAKGEIGPGEKVNFAVPTGNFGNILAAYYASEMGLPVNRLICASNANNVLTDFIRTGVYNRNRPFQKTISPSMDILISSNLERLLYHLCGRDSARVRGWMEELNKNGSYRIDERTRNLIAGIFWAGFAGDDETVETIRSVYRRYGYVVDTHTAVGLNVYEKYRATTGDGTKTILASTASPFKFNESVARAILGEEAVRGKGELELLEVLSAASGVAVPPGLKNLAAKPVLHTKSTPKERMKETVRDILKP